MKTRRRRRLRKHGKVELNLAAMLDMAFQLLAFFILTFKPMPVEGQISLKLPPPKPVSVVGNGVKPGEDRQRRDLLEGVNSLVITVLPDPGGAIGSLAVGDAGVADLAALDIRLRAIFEDVDTPFDQVLIQVGSRLRYDRLLAVIDVCSKQRLPDGSTLSRLSFVEIPVE